MGWVPWDCLVSSPTEHSAYSCLGISGLDENSICFDVVAQCRHECLDQCYMVIFVVGEDGFEVGWEWG